MDRMRLCIAVPFLYRPCPMPDETTADFLSRVDLDHKEEVQLLIRDDIETSPINYLLQSSDVTEEE